MIQEESIWIRDNILKFGKQYTTPSLLNIGSSTKKFREVDQPHISELFNAVESNGIRVQHLDIKADDGVDIVGDLNNPDFLKLIQADEYPLVLCSNLLEHILYPDQICNAIENLVADDGLILVTGPYVYRYHSDPIDTMFRPTPDELLKLFPNCEMVKGEILNINNTFFKDLFRDKKELLVTLIRIFTPFYKFRKWRKLIFKSLPYMFINYRVTCVVLRKVNDSTNFEKLPGI